MTVARIRSGYKWTSGEFTKEQDYTLLQGFRTHGARRQTYELRGMRTQTHLDRWLVGLAARYAGQPTMVEISLRTLRFFSAQPGTFISLTWPKMSWTNHILKVLNTSIDPWAQTQTITCFDTRLTKGAGWTLTPDVSALTAAAAQRRPVQRPIAVLT